MVAGFVAPRSYATLRKWRSPAQLLRVRHSNGKMVGHGVEWFAIHHDTFN